MGMLRFREPGFGAVGRITMSITAELEKRGKGCIGCFVCENVCSNGAIKMILDGEVDHLPEQAFLNVGTIDDAIAKGEKLLAQAQA